MNPISRELAVVVLVFTKPALDQEVPVVSRGPLVGVRRDVDADHGADQFVLDKTFVGRRASSDTLASRADREVPATRSQRCLS